MNSLKLSCVRLREGVIQIDEFQSRNHMSVHIEILHASSIIESNDRHPFRPLRTMYFFFFFVLAFVSPFFLWANSVLMRSDDPSRTPF